jgi:hypothetical protein
LLLLPTASVLNVKMRCGMTLTGFEMIKLNKVDPEDRIDERIEFSPVKKRKV